MEVSNIETITNDFEYCIKSFKIALKSYNDYLDEIYSNDIRETYENLYGHYLLMNHCLEHIEKCNFKYKKEIDLYYLNK